MGRTEWRTRRASGRSNASVVTAGDVVFYGTMDRWFKAIDARTGKELWKFQVDSGIVSQPMTYLGPDGKSQVTVEYQEGKPARVDTIVVSSQHSEEILDKTGKRITQAATDEIIQKVVLPVMPAPTPKARPGPGAGFI